MKILNRPSAGVAVALSIFFAGSARADRPDHPVLASSIVTAATDSLVIANVNPTYTTLPESTLVCVRQATGFTVTLSGSLLDADLTKSKTSGLSQKQSAYMVMALEIDDGVNPPLTFGPGHVASCKGKAKIADGDADLDYDGGSDKGSGSFKCEDDIPAALGLDAGQTTAFHEAFGTKPSCKVKGVPALVP